MLVGTTATNTTAWSPTMPALSPVTATPRMTADQWLPPAVQSEPPATSVPVTVRAGWRDYLRSGLMYAAPLALAAGVGAAIAGGAGAAIGAAVGVAFWGVVGLGIYGNARGWW